VYLAALFSRFAIICVTRVVSASTHTGDAGMLVTSWWQACSIIGLHASTAPRTAVPRSIVSEAKIAERVLSDVEQVDGLGKQVPYNCPNCGGVLWEMGASKANRYRCHTGHSFTQEALLASQSEKIEEVLWISLRMFEERKNLLTSMGKMAVHRSLKSSNHQRLREIEGHIERIRSLLLSPQSEGADDSPKRVNKA
jgi:two-component system, chemotaxis family, protein-glutamate methylesterase/glutaminase